MREDVYKRQEYVCFSNGEAMMKAGGVFDMAFLDVEMDGISGIPVSYTHLDGYKRQPPRGAVQVEMSLTDARILGITIPVNLSGDLKGAADVILVGPKGIYNAVGSVIASKAHIHMTPENARLYVGCLLYTSWPV